jgi:methylglutaconyl-CoA hydratase
MAEEHLKIERHGPVTRITLDRPAIHNAFDDQLVAHLARTAGDIAEDERTRVVILAGEGKSFCAGADLNWMKRMVDYGEEENIADSSAMARMFEAWNTLPQPVIGRIHGAALGGGVGLVSICDIGIASTEAVFAFTEVRLGILPAVISPFAIGKIGATAARELFLTGERIDAERAREIGLVQRVVSPDSLDEEVQKVVDLLLAGGPEAQRRSKEVITEVKNLSPEDARTITASTIARARAGKEGQEGIRAFLERRKPVWREND